MQFLSLSEQLTRISQCLLKLSFRFLCRNDALLVKSWTCPCSVCLCCIVAAPLVVLVLGELVQGAGPTKQMVTGLFKLSLNSVLQLEPKILRLVF